MKNPFAKTEITKRNKRCFPFHGHRRVIASKSLTLCFSIL
jgi:hypothetical protein